MLCGLGVPSLRSLWGAVRNRQLYILRMYCKGCISFSFSIFFIIYMTYRKKKNYTTYRKNKKIQNFFYNSHDLTAKKNYTHLQQKKITQLYGFFVHDLHFSHRHPPAGERVRFPRPSRGKAAGAGTAAITTTISSGRDRGCSRGPACGATPPIATRSGVGGAGTSHCGQAAIRRPRVKTQRVKNITGCLQPPHPHRSLPTPRWPWLRHPCGPGPPPPLRAIPPPPPLTPSGATGSEGPSPASSVAVRGGGGGCPLWIWWPLVVAVCDPGVGIDAAARRGS